jgi:hypothetical protein
MRVYTTSEARQKFAALLERARRDGAVRIRRRDGQVFLIQPEHSLRSPFDVDGVLTHLSTDDIVDVIRETRERVNAPHPKKSAHGAVRKRAKKTRR